MNVKAPYPRKCRTLFYSFVYFSDKAIDQVLVSSRTSDRSNGFGPGISCRAPLAWSFNSPRSLFGRSRYLGNPTPASDK
ncbi:MAG: hypothetical protein DMG54_02590 [Acidobacteria bacterium]|nr:MAG: hypothetical protein DMG54_02590 [Acidobacteriota bacterium]